MPWLYPDLRFSCWGNESRIADRRALLGALYPRHAACTRRSKRSRDQKAHIEHVSDAEVEASGNEEQGRPDDNTTTPPRASSMHDVIWQSISNRVSGASR